MGTFSSLCNEIVDFGTNNSNPRYQPITKITPHHMAGNPTASDCARYHLNGGRQASANYYIGTDGTICGGVSEDRRAWTSSSEWNDQRAITFEVANNTFEPNWTISDKAYSSLVRLCADVCKRYAITPHWDGSTNGSITMHKQFASTGCPGPYLEKIITSGQFEKDIFARLTDFRYRVHQQTYGWLPWVVAGEVAGYTGRSKRIESIILESTKYNFMYMVHQQTYGDSKWFTNGQQAGVTGQAKRLEGIAIKCTTPGKHVRYKVHQQGTGWTNWAKDGEFCGSRGKQIRIEAIIVEVY